MTSPVGFEPDLTRWEPWRPQEVQRRLARVRAPWCVTAGWAIDLFVAGGEDGRGLVWPLPAAADRLGTSHQTWVREPATELWRLDALVHPGHAWLGRL